MKNYIIGYGSLINVESQNITGKSLSSIPIILKGYSRSWSVVYDDLQFCALGVYPQKNSSINAVLFEVEDLPAFDKREHGYTRHELDLSFVSPWTPQFKIPQAGKIWIYLPFIEKFGRASEEHLIWQSYLDVIFMGCLAIDQKFGEEFIKTTEGWNLHYLNDDRKESAYLRALKSYDRESIDQLMRLVLRPA